MPNRGSPSLLFTNCRELRSSRKLDYRFRAFLETRLVYVTIDDQLRLAWELSQALREACLGRNPKAPRFRPF